MIDPETRLPVEFSHRERELIVTLMGVDPEIAHRFNLAILKQGALMVNLSADDLEGLLGEIAAEAHHTENKKLRKELDKLFERLDRVLALQFPEHEP